MQGVDAVIASVKNLPSLPIVAVKIIQQIKSEKISNNELAEIISYDPALTAKILKIANSAFYGISDGVDSIDRAVHILGQAALKNIALSFVIVKGLKRNNVDNFDHELFWKRSITAAVSAEMLSSKLKVNRGDTFVIPLLMDIGVLVMYLSNSSEYLKVFDEKRVSGITTIEAEQGVFGYDHQELGSGILKKWNLPDNISLPIAYHHNPEQCPAEMKDLVEVLHLADVASSVYHSSNSNRKMGEFRELLKEKLQISDEEIGEFIDGIAEKTIEVLGTFEIDPGDMKPYSQILEEANTELGKMNLSYEQLVMELKQEKSKVEILARDLKEVNDKLRGLAFEDGLTGLFNQRYFQEHIEREISRVDRYSHLLSLIMIDIDQAIALNPGDVRPYLLKCEMLKLVKSANKNEYIGQLDGFIQQFPEEPKFFAERGMAHVLNYNYGTAVSDFTKAIHLDEKNEANYRNRALCFHNMKKYQLALNDYTKSVDLLIKKYQESQDDDEAIKKLLAQTINMRGMTNQLNGNPDLACDDYYNAAKLGSKSGLNNYRKNCNVYN